MSGVDEIREAAALMRVRAKAATVWDGWWEVHSERPGRVIEDKHRNGYDDAIIASCIDYGGTENGSGKAPHIASWDPSVALAVAKAMSDVADAWEIAGEYTTDLDGDAIRFEDTIDGGWLKVARAYLGRQS